MIEPKADNAAMTAAMSATFRRMAALTGFDQRAVLTAEVAVILKTWAGKTKVTTQAQVDRRSKYRAIRGLGYTSAENRGDVTVNAGYKKAPFGRVWIKVRKGNARENFLLAMGNGFTEPGNAAVGPKGVLKGRSRIVNGVFNKYRPKASATTRQWVSNIVNAVDESKSAVARAEKRGRQSIGFARQSVVQIADSLGIDLLRVPGGGTLSSAGIAKARAALASTGKSYRNGTGRSSGQALGSFYIDIKNTLPFGGRIGMDATLRGIISGRTKYFEQSYAKGAFNSQSTACRAYPALFSFRSPMNLVGGFTTT